MIATIFKFFVENSTQFLLVEMAFIFTTVVVYCVLQIPTKSATTEVNALSPERAMTPVDDIQSFFNDEPFFPKTHFGVILDNEYKSLRAAFNKENANEV